MILMDTPGHGGNLASYIHLTRVTSVALPLFGVAEQALGWIPQMSMDLLN